MLLTHALLCHDDGVSMQAWLGCNAQAKQFEENLIQVGKNHMETGLNPLAERQGVME